MNHIRSGTTGITEDNLTADIEMLIDQGHTTGPELRKMCNAIDELGQAIHKLDGTIEKHMPHRTSGGCNGLGVVGHNRLLTLFFSIQDSAIDFQSGTEIVLKRVDKILTGKEQQEPHA